MDLFKCILTAAFTLTILSVGGAHADLRAADGSIAIACAIAHTGNDFTSNRFNGMPNGMLQVTLLYDGRDATAGGNPRLKIQLKAPSGAMGFIHIGTGYPGGTIDGFGAGIETRQYRIGDCRLTGRVEVSGVVADGSVDGIAFGLMVRYGDGTYRVVRSVGPPSVTGDFVGRAPHYLSTQQFAQRASELTHGFAHEQGWMMLFGAQLLGNGLAEVPVR